jgi:adenylate cyclase
MNSPIIKRKLSAIISADVKGYSRLMGDDEEATVRTITAHRGMMTALIEQNGGRVVDSPGDNLLAEFSSVVEATQCAVEIQKVLKTKNDELPENRRMEFRIGINLGDVIQEGDRIYGDGVNIAARIEGLSDAGGICISGSAYEQIDRRAKNKSRRWQPAAIIAAVLVLIIGGGLIWSLYLRNDRIPATVETETKQASKLPDQPSIAVLPFVNMSGDPGQEYFSDGITENIIAGLSKLPGLLVIARNSTFTYKGKPVDVKQLGVDLGVQYVLEGSVQRSEDRVRIIAQLIDASSAQHLWAERYDRDLTDIFALQDEITLKIISALPLDLKGREKSRLAAEGTENLDAYAKVLQGMQALRGRGRPGDIQKARRIAEEVIALDPDYPKGYTLLASTYIMEAMRKRDRSSPRSVARAFELAQKALELDNTNIEAHIILGRIYLMRNQDEMAAAELEKAKAINPNSTEVAHALGRHYLQTGKPHEALEMFEKAVRLDPIHAQKSYVNLGRTYRLLGKHEEAISIFKKAVQNAPDHLNIRLELIATYSALGKTVEAKAEADEVLRMNPNFTVRSFARRSPMQNPTQREKFLDLLRQAGLPE